MIDIVFSVIAVILFSTVSYKITRQIIKNRSHPDFRLERFYIEKRKFSDGFVIEVSEDSLDNLDSCNSHYKYLKKQTAFKELKVTYKRLIVLNVKRWLLGLKVNLMLVELKAFTLVVLTMLRKKSTVFDFNENNCLLLSGCGV